MAEVGSAVLEVWPGVGLGYERFFVHFSHEQGSVPPVLAVSLASGRNGPVWGEISGRQAAPLAAVLQASRPASGTLAPGGVAEAS